MKIYLDMCSFNRPYDDQTYIKIKLEAEAKLFIQREVKEGRLKLAWSYILEFENEDNPYKERRETIESWIDLAFIDVEPSESILKQAEALEKKGIKADDALHIACAISAKCDYFITTDYKLIKKAVDLNQIHVMNPVDYIRILEDKK
ncbi:MAG: PIN domain-containing protein [Leptospiraceae bacterium]|nr:PIN domain-containing protein [Leptospiraceae bacterium]